MLTLARSCCLLNNNSTGSLCWRFCHLQLFTNTGHKFLLINGRIHVGVLVFRNPGMDLHFSTMWFPRVCLNLLTQWQHDAGLPRQWDRTAVLHTSATTVCSRRSPTWAGRVWRDQSEAVLGSTRSSEKGSSSSQWNSAPCWWSLTRDHTVDDWVMNQLSKWLHSWENLW